jgi:hypothetical protein
MNILFQAIDIIYKESSGFQHLKIVIVISESDSVLRFNALYPATVSMIMPASYSTLPSSSLITEPPRAITEQLRSYLRMMGSIPDMPLEEARTSSLPESVQVLSAVTVFSDIL